MKAVLVVFLLACTLIPETTCFNPYQVLNLKRSASAQDIKNAYKRLAKKWHPDRNKNSEAESRFIDITKSYGILSDPKKKMEYDLHGTVSGDPNPTPTNTEFFFDDSGMPDFVFNFFSNRLKGNSFYQKHRITATVFNDVILPESMTKPTLILFFSDWCGSCKRLEPTWKAIVEDVETRGLGVATINMGAERYLNRKLKIREIPAIRLILAGKIYHYNQFAVRIDLINDFLRDSPLSQGVVRITNKNIREFVEGWSDNKVRVLFFCSRYLIRINYLIVAFQLRSYAVFGYVQLGLPETAEIARTYRVSSSKETLIVLNENPDDAVVFKEMHEIPFSVLQDLVSSHNHLLLSRVSSQDGFDQLCPPQYGRNPKFLCVILLSEHSNQKDLLKNKLRSFLFGFELKDQLRVMYVNKWRQNNFVKAFTTSAGLEQHLIVLWRKEDKILKYQWLDEGQEPIMHMPLETFKEKLQLALKKVMRSDTVWSETYLQELEDEDGPGYLTRLPMLLDSTFEFIKDAIDSEELAQYFPMLLPFGSIALSSYLLSLASKFKKMNEQQDAKIEEIQELNDKTYDSLVRHVDPGRRVLVLVVDEDSSHKLLSQYKRLKNHFEHVGDFTFAYIRIDQHLKWYMELLTLSLPDRKPVNVNPRLCVGTVLSLNGYHRYFCIYHAKYHDSGDVKESWRSEYGEGGSGDIELPVHRLLDGLPKWLDRLSEGQTRRFYIQAWPKMTNN